MTELSMRLYVTEETLALSLAELVPAQAKAAFLAALRDNPGWRAAGEPVMTCEYRLEIFNEDGENGDPEETGEETT